MPVNPIKARLIKEAIIKAIGMPIKDLGVSFKLRRSLIEDINNSASANPIPAQNPCKIDKTKLNLTCPDSLKNVLMFKTVTPKTAQLVVIRGRYIPNAL